MRSKSITLPVVQQTPQTSHRQSQRSSFVVHSIRQLMRRRLEHMQYGLLRISDHWGEWQVGKQSNIGNIDNADTPTVRITVHNPEFYWNLLLGGSNGAAAAYRDGFWSCDDLTALFKLVLNNSAAMDAMENGWAKAGNWLMQRRHKARANTHGGSRRNIHAHYDLGNDLFELFLDPTMTYSAGIFASETDSLEQASLNKLDRICKKLALCPEDHVIEIGSGWGSFALHAAANYGCRVTTTTISREQFKLAEQRIRAAGLQDRIELLLSDYRDLKGQYDKLVSIEMIEAVGHRFLPTYFGKCAELLKPDGQMLIQAISMPDQRYAQYLKNSDFIQQFIFPGSCCPSLSAMLDAVAKASDLSLVQLEDIAPDYARTLALWRDNFRARESEVRELGYDDGFIRMWEYYLCYCEAGFGERYLRDLQLLLRKPQCRAEAVLGAFV